MIQRTYTSEQLLRDFESLLPRAFLTTTRGQYKGQGLDWASADLYEEEEGLVLEIDLPGLSEGDVTVEYKDGLLSIRAARELTKKPGLKTSERRDIRLDRSFKVPSYIEESKIEAQMSNGVLRVTMPKTEKVASKRIDVKSG
tara:strand:+ start:398 stop:823 length:426 start_codon:yes stop_codon:yes gene_type:complete